jgi:1,2-diacylglycerol 3-beta-galactosyltransferase
MAALRRIPRILFLIADTGGGHRSAANAIRAAMSLIAPEIALDGNLAPAVLDVATLPFDPHALVPPGWGGGVRPWHGEIHDIIAECGPLPMRRMAGMYGVTVARRPRVYAGMWHATNTRATYAALTALTTRLLRRALADMLQAMQPDIIVSVHSLLTQPTLDILRGLNMHLPFITIVTDLVRFHRSWAQPDVDVCSVPTPAARDLMIDFGMPPEKIRLLGMPIHPKFCLPTADGTATRVKLGLDPDRFTVLLVGGGEGMGKLGEYARAIGAAQLPAQLLVVAGRNHALRAELEAARATLGMPAAILGFVENMPDLMRAADVIVTKAGPGTIAEALACGLPIILTGAVPGQEVGNIDYVVQQHVGVLARTSEEIVAAVRDLAASTPDELAALSAHTLELSHPRAAFDIAKLILSYVPPPSQPSQWNRVASTAMRNRYRRSRGRRPRGLRRWLGRRPRPSQPRPSMARRIPGFAPLQRVTLLMRRRGRRASYKK